MSWRRFLPGPLYRWVLRYETERYIRRVDRRLAREAWDHMAADHPELLEAKQRGNRAEYLRALREIVAEDRLALMRTHGFHAFLSARLHKQGFTDEQIEEALRFFPVKRDEDP